MNGVVLKYCYSPGFTGDFISTDLLISGNFETKLKFFWYFDQGYFLDNDFERKQQRRFTVVFDKLPQGLQVHLEKLIKSDLKVIVPEKIKTDKILYSTSAHPSNEYYKIIIQNEEKYINIPYYLTKTLIEEPEKEFFLDFHVKLKAWMDTEFEAVSAGKAIRFNKKENGNS